MAQQIQKYLIGDDVTKMPVNGEFPDRFCYWVNWEDVAPYITEENLQQTTNKQSTPLLYKINFS